MNDDRFSARIAFLVLLLASAAVSAQPFTLDENIKPLKLTLKDDPNYEGIQFTSASGTIGSTASYLFANTFSPQRVVVAQLFSIAAEQPATLTVVKELWTEPGRSCTTDAAGVCDVKFRTSGDAGFRINGVTGSKWRLLLMVSPEIPREVMMPSPFFEADKADAARLEHGGTLAAPASGSDRPAGAESGGGDALVWIGAAAVVLLAVIAVLLARLLGSRNQSAAGALLPLFTALALLFVAAPEPAVAEDPVESDSESIDVDLTELNEEIEAEAKAREEARKQMEKAAKRTQTALKILMDAKSAYDRWFGDLSNCAAMSNPAGAPRIPSFCAGDPRCQGCYTVARTDFNEVRGVFEQLRIIYSCNKKAIDAAIKFGDSASGVHGVTGLAWQTIKLDIEESVKGLKKAYDDKYLELTQKLHDSMIEIARCEAKWGEPDWYDRFGYVYFEFMADKYKRSD
ncbi:MAG: hypothetical protein MJA32_13975 [Proteobacteria bacterium]|nr:hypothetical protein [Pseudomonadota bacterium]